MDNFKNAKDFQTFLDTYQYSKEGILRYEFMFGAGYLSSGGFDTTKELLDLAELKKNDKVLDIGCGIGGGCEYICNRFGASVYGVDLSENVIQLANERYASRTDLKFAVEDAVTMKADDESFDLIYSRDCILHLDLIQKQTLFSNCWKWLKHGGMLFITDYCASQSDAWSESFKSYVKSRGYTLLTVEEYGDLIKEAGFKLIKQEDITQRWIKALESEMVVLKEKRVEFLKKFDEEDFDVLVNGWSAKIERAKEGMQLWGWMVAVKE